MSSLDDGSKSDGTLDNPGYGSFLDSVGMNERPLLIPKSRPVNPLMSGTLEPADGIGNILA